MWEGEDDDGVVFFFRRLTRLQGGLGVLFFFSFAMLNECKWFLQQLGFYAILAPSFIYRNGWKGLWEVNNDNDMEKLQKGGCGL